jgi:hypothetical protein
VAAKPQIGGESSIFEEKWKKMRFFAQTSQFLKRSSPQALNFLHFSSAFFENKKIVFTLIAKFIFAPCVDAAIFRCKRLVTKYKNLYSLTFFPDE